MTVPFPSMPREAPAVEIAESRFDVANRLFFRLYQGSNLMHKVGTRFVAGFGVTTQQWAVLGALSGPRARTRGMTVKELLEFLLVSRQNLTLVLDRLEDRGWIKRMKDPADNRSRRIRLTRDGEEVWARMLARIAEFYGAALKDLSFEEQVTLFRLLNRLKTTLSRL
jgi:DNA-binding MarR family transcriptional regulator